MKKKQEKFIHVGDFVARIEVDLIYKEDSWSPCISLEDAEKLDKIRIALLKGDLNSASENAKIFRLTPVTKAA